MWSYGHAKRRHGTGQPRRALLGRKRLRSRLVTRMPYGHRMTQEANAHGKAMRYADVGPVTWTVEARIGVHMA